MVVRKSVGWLLFVFPLITSSAEAQSEFDAGGRLTQLLSPSTYLAMELERPELLTVLAAYDHEAVRLRDRANDATVAGCVLIAVAAVTFGLTHETDEERLLRELEGRERNTVLTRGVPILGGAVGIAALVTGIVNHSRAARYDGWGETLRVHLLTLDR